MNSILIENATIINEGKTTITNLKIKNHRIEQIGTDISYDGIDTIVNAEGLHLLPGLIDDQVHFREPGATNKATIKTEAMAAVAGGTTSFMDMPNTKPQTTTIEEWNNKMSIGSKDSIANYGFFLGATNDNLDELKKLDPQKCPGIKVFMGSSTGNMLVDKEDTLEQIFKENKAIIATHCERTDIIQKNEQLARERYGEDVPIKCHPEIRSREACIESSKIAIKLAQKYQSNLHIFHLSTKEETELLRSINASKTLKNKIITAEVCLPHLMFTDKDYNILGTKIKCNPAVKAQSDREALIDGIKNKVIDIIATDHAPHEASEKNNSYFKAPSGIPMCQHTLSALLELYHDGHLSLEDIVTSTSHNVADRYHIQDRGFIREGYFADLVLVDLNGYQTVNKEQILYKCGWSPFEGKTFRSRIISTWVNGTMAFCEGVICSNEKGMAMDYNR